MMLETGNKLFNSVYEANAPATVKPKPEDDSDTKQAFIQAKYAQRRYVQKLASQPGEVLCRFVYQHACCGMTMGINQNDAMPLSVFDCHICFQDFKPAALNG
eukprot:TRINITY_DN9443_c0_g1_i4.p4 TRINITY_DN9443_c0_g1~~TRINITY_DN9443_c0_g1_i4.p4  ORF type:complete len:102 (+),score=22.21 TRINITY_DN9443_c0_g1_i4:1862-2167(+)